MGRPKTQPPPPPGSHKRVHERFDLIAQIEVEQAGELRLLPARNISLGGMLVELEPNEPPGVEVGDEVSVHIDVGNDADGVPLDLTVVAEVVRIEAGSDDRRRGFAVMWTSDDPAVLGKLGRLLRHLRES